MKDTYDKDFKKTRQRFLRAFSFMLLMTLTLVLPKYVWAGQLVVTGRYVNLRQGPATSYELVGRVYQGDKLSYISSKDGWYQLTWGNQKPWIAGWLVKEDQTPAPSQPATSVAKQVVVTGTYVNVRSGPSTSYGKVGQVKKDDQLAYISESNQWVKVKLADGKEGWLAGWLVKATEDAKPAEKPTTPTTQTNNQNSGSSGGTTSQTIKQVLVTGTYVNVRSGPSTSYGKVGQVKKDDQLAYISESNQWVKVKLADGKEGWLAGWLVKIQTTQVSQQPQPPVASKPVASGKQAIVRGTYVNVRSGPGIDNAKISVVFKGDQLVVQSVTGDWVKIKLKDGKDGWIAGWLVDLKDVPQSAPTPTPTPTPAPTPTPTPTPTPSPAPATQKYATITGSIVNLRGGAGTSYAILAKAKQGDRYKVVGSSQDWYQLELTSGQKAWVAGWLITIKSESVPQPAPQPAPTPGDSGSDSTGASRGGQPTNSDIDQQSGEAVHKLVKTNRIGIFVRKGPSESISIFDTLTKDVELTVYRETNNWYLVQLPEKDQQGWIVKSVADEVHQETTSATDLVVKMSSSNNSQAVIDGVQGKYETVSDPNGLWFKVVFPEAIFTKESVVNLNQGMVSRYELKKLPSASEGIELTFFFISKTYAKVTTGESEDQLQVQFSTGGLDGKTIVLDPGHGDFDPGASGPSGLQEKDVVLDIGKRVAENLRQLGANVLMTRDDDTFVPLGVRADLANTKNADIFVSIHANSSEKSSVTGTSTYFYAPSSEPDLYAQYNQRSALASAVQTDLVNALGTRNLGLKQERFAVIRLTKMPSILVETAFISNPTEEQNLADSNFRAKAAQGIAQGIQEYFQAQ